MKAIKPNNSFIMTLALVIITTLVISEYASAGEWKTATIGEDWEVNIPAKLQQLSADPKPVYISQNPQMLTILEYSATATSCPDYLKTTQKQTLKLLADPLQQQLMKLMIMPVTMGGRVGIISEGGTRTPDEVKEGSPMRPISILAICVEERGMITINISLRQGEITDQQRDMLSQIAESIRPANNKSRETSLYSKTCPGGVKNCLPQNQCNQCDKSCGYCQNLDSSSCGPDDCMSCKDGKKLQQLYDDGTGRCG